MDVYCLHRCKYSFVLFSVNVVTGIFQLYLKTVKVSFIMVAKYFMMWCTMIQLTILLVVHIWVTCKIQSLK